MIPIVIALVILGGGAFAVFRLRSKTESSTSLVFLSGNGTSPLIPRLKVRMVGSLDFRNKEIEVVSLPPAYLKGQIKIGQYISAPDAGTAYEIRSARKLQVIGFTRKGEIVIQVNGDRCIERSLDDLKRWAYGFAGSQGSPGYFDVKKHLWPSAQDREEVNENIQKVSSQSIAFSPSGFCGHSVVNMESL